MSIRSLPIRLPFVSCVASLAIAGIAAGQNLSDRLQGMAERQKQASSSSKPRMLGSLLYTDISVDFNQTPAKDAFEYVAKVLDIPIVARFDTDKAGTGIDPETPITLKADGKPGLTVIELILEQCATVDPCTWQLREGFVEVGTKERLSVPAARELRMYPVRDLLFEAPYFDNAPNFNLNSAIQQGNSGGQGGGGSGGGGGGGGGFGGGGGGGGMGGGGGGSGGGGGGVFGEPGEDPERKSEDEKVQQLVDIILETIEPDAWTDNGGDWASIRFYQGVLIVRAPDYIHRQIGGYPFAARPASLAPSVGSRYVTFDAPISIVNNVGFRPVRVEGAAGGAGAGGGR